MPNEVFTALETEVSIAQLLDTTSIYREYSNNTSFIIDRSNVSFDEPVITITGRSFSGVYTADPKLYIAYEDGSTSWLQYTGTLTSTDTLIIDCRKKKASLNGTPAGITGSFFELREGLNTIMLTCSGAAKAGVMIVNLLPEPSTILQFVESIDASLKKSIKERQAYNNPLVSGFIVTESKYECSMGRLYIDKSDLDRFKARELYHIRLRLRNADTGQDYFHYMSHCLLDSLTIRSSGDSFITADVHFTVREHF